MICEVPLAGVLKSRKGKFCKCTCRICTVTLVVSSFDLPATMSGLMSVQLTGHREQGTFHMFVYSLTFTVNIKLFVSLAVFLKTKLVSARLVGSPLDICTLQILTPKLLVITIVTIVHKCFRKVKAVLPATVSRVVRRMFGTIVDVINTDILFNVKAGTKRGSKRRLLKPTCNTTKDALKAIINSLSKLLFLLFIVFLCGGIVHGRLGESHARGIRDCSFLLGTLLLATVPIMFDATMCGVGRVVSLAVFGRIVRSRNCMRGRCVTLRNVCANGCSALVGIPVTVTGTLKASLIPDLATIIATNAGGRIRDGVGRALHLAVMVTVPDYINCFMLTSPVVILLCGSSDTAPTRLLVTKTVIIMLCKLSSMAGSVLRKLGCVADPTGGTTTTLKVRLMTFMIVVAIFGVGICTLINKGVMFTLTVDVLGLLGVQGIDNFGVSFMEAFKGPFTTTTIVNVMAFNMFELFSALVNNHMVPMYVSLVMTVLICTIIVLGVKALSRSSVLSLPVNKHVLEVSGGFRLLPTMGMRRWGGRGDRCYVGGKTVYSRGVRS